MIFGDLFIDVRQILRNFTFEFWKWILYVSDTIVMWYELT